MCFFLLLLESFPFFSKIMELLLSWCRKLSLTLYPCAGMKYQVQKIADMKSSTPAISVSMEIFVLIFCFVELTIGNPLPKYKPPPEWPRILGWTANNASTHHFKIPLTLALRVTERFLVPLRYCIRCTSIPQSSSSFACTLVFINSMAVQVSGLAPLVSYKVFATTLWNSTTFS